MIMGVAISVHKFQVKFEKGLQQLVVVENGHCLTYYAHLESILVTVGQTVEPAPESDSLATPVLDRARF
jgi:hypothetical protein